MQKSATTAKASILYALTILITYKILKYVLRNNFGVNPVDTYYFYEIVSSGFRIIGALIAIKLVRDNFKFPSHQFTFGRGAPLSLIITYTLGFLALKLFFLNPHLGSIGGLVLETFIDLAVGFFEEFLFAGLLLTGIWFYTGFTKAAILTSLIFSLFHLDVYQEPKVLVNIFLAGLISTLFLRLKLPLLTLALSHFLWDLIHFGGNWSVKPFTGSNFTFFEIAYHCVFIAILLKLISNNQKTNSLIQ